MRKYIVIIILLFVGIALLAFNRMNIGHFDNYSLIMDVQLIGLTTILISILLTFIPKLRNPIFLKTLLTITILIVSSEFILSYKSLQEFNRTNFINSYYDKNCDELLKRFEFDKTQNKFAYFSYGIGVDSEGIKREFKEKYNVDIVAIGKGCSGNEANHCYNIALMDFLESKIDTIKENSQPIDKVKSIEWSVDTISNCNIKLDSINNNEYKWHKFILTESKKDKNGRDCFREGKKINKCLYPQDIAMFINSINPDEEGIYRILTNKVVFYLLENETKILEYGVNWEKDSVKSTYFMQHLEHPLCNTLTIDSIIKKIKIELDTSIYDMKFNERLLKHLQK